MEALLFFRPNSEHERAVLEFLHDFERQTGKTVTTVDVDSREGMHLCELYDITQYPTILAKKDDGTEIMRWGGLPLPRISEVSFYAKPVR